MCVTISPISSIWPTIASDGARHGAGDADDGRADDVDRDVLAEGSACLREHRRRRRLVARQAGDGQQALENVGKRHDAQPSWRAGSRTVAAAASADQQHELPAHVTVLADAVRLRDLGEREGLRDREREAPGLDQLADLGERVDRAAGVPAAERHPVLLRATEVGDRHDVLRAARELDELGQDAAPGDVERGVDAVRRERANPPR
jgi:hypothetical protein